MGTAGNPPSRPGFRPERRLARSKSTPKRKRQETPMSDFKPGLEGVIAFETEIAEPDKEGGALRYRGVDIEELVGHVSYGHVWGLLVDNAFAPGLPPAEPYPIPAHSGDIRVDVQSAQAARGPGLPMVPQRQVDAAMTITERFMIRWRGEPDPQHVKAIDAYWSSAAEHGMNASTFTARVIASTGADVAAALSGAVGAMSGPLHGGAPARVLHMIEEVERTGDAVAYVKEALDQGDRLMGFGHRVYRAEDPRARVLRRTARDLGAPRYEVAAALEEAALAELHARRPDRVLATNVEFWAAIMLDFAQVPPHMFTSMFTCARTAGWAAHILEQKQTGRLVRPSARYVGPPARSVRDVPGAADVLDNDV